jgi:hypothetical protein
MWLLVGLAFAQVRVNGVEVQLPGVPAGQYWYDAQSGLWGLQKGPAQGVIAPGMALGALAADASAGDTGVFINGRQLPQIELVWLSSRVGAVAPGRYFLDPWGNAGPEGGPAVVNLYAAAGGGAGGGGGGGGGTFYNQGSTSTVSGGSWDGGGIVTVRNSDGSSTSVGW